MRWRGPGSSAALKRPRGGRERSRASSARVVPLTESQTEIWLSAQNGDEASCAFNESVTLRLNGPLDLAALHAAMDAVMARHDALRARFSATGRDDDDLPGHVVSVSRSRISPGGWPRRTAS